jgi:outer membrane protein assembly factor BamB
MTHNFDLNAMKTLVNRAVVQPSMSRQGEEKILSRIAEYTQKKATRRNPLLSVIYNPALAFVAVIPLLAILGVFVTIRLAGVVGYPAPAIVMVSGTAIVESKAKTIESGYKLGENEKIDIPSGRICDLTIKNKASFRLFPNSSFSVSGTTQSPARLAVSLEKGSLYLEKHGNLDDGKILQVRMRDYLFDLAGTRVLFQSFEKQLRVFCFGGKVRISLNRNGSNRELYSLLAHEKIDIMTEGDKRNYIIDDFLSEEAVRFDKDFIGFPGLDPEMLSRYSSILGITPPERDEKHGIDTESLKNAGKKTAQQEEKEPFIITSIGNIRDRSFADASINFIATAQDSDTAYVITQGSLFTLSNDRVKEAVRFSPTPIFKVKPVLAGNTLCLVSTRNIYLIDKGTLAVKSTIPLPETGSAEDNYFPTYASGTLYIPVLNNGIYTVKPDETNPSLSRFYKELFAITPVITDTGITVGSSYSNYIAQIDAKGASIWKYPLNGKSFSNFIVINNDIYTYILQNSKPSILRIDGNGKKKNQYMLGSTVIADLVANGRIIFGFYSNGDLFGLDTTTGGLKTIDNLYKTKLTSRAWRLIATHFENDILYAGTDSGELFIYDTVHDKIEKRTIIKNDERFYASPAKIGNAIYLFSNKGEVFRIVKNDR